ncbi:MAG: NADPH:quinone reductase [Sedimentitalea sp.]
MKAITYRAFGPASDVLTLEDLPPPSPGPGEVVVDMAYSGVNPSDVKARAGARAGVTSLPYPVIVPHSDGSGVISAIGEGVPEARLGQRVWIWNGQWQRAFGTAAQQIALPMLQTVPLPGSIDLETGATLGIPGLTACYTVFSGGPVQGKTVLVQGGNGTVGFLAVQLAKWGGARVIATANPGTASRVRAVGADVVLDYAAPDLAAQILEANAGRPVDHIVEVEFGRNAVTDTEVIAQNGRICAYGSAQIMQPELPFYPLMFKAVTLQMALVYLLSPVERTATILKLSDALTHGALHSPIADIYAMEHAAQAHMAVEKGGRSGSVLIRTGD